MNQIWRWIKNFFRNKVDIYNFSKTHHSFYNQRTNDFKIKSLLKLKVNQPQDKFSTWMLNHLIKYYDALKTFSSISNNYAKTGCHKLLNGLILLSETKLILCVLRKRNKKRKNYYMFQGFKRVDKIIAC